MASRRKNFNRKTMRRKSIRRQNKRRQNKRNKSFDKQIGEMAEWLNAPVLKTGNRNRFWGSNPCLSALYYVRI